MNTQFDALREQAEHYERQKKYVQALMLYKTIPDLPEYDENMKQIICDKICNIGDELLKETKGIPIKTQRVKHFWGLQRRKKFLARRSFKKAANTFKIHIPSGYKKLLKVYEKALKIDPSYPHGYKKVLKVYEEALKIDPYYSQAVYQIAYTYLHLKDYQEAARWFRDYCDVAEQSEYASALRKICDIGDIFYKQQKKITKAIRTYKKILEIVPEYEKTFSIESPIYFETPDQGIEPEYVRAFEALGTIYFDAGDYENASDIYIRYCELEQYNNDAALHRLIEICDKYYQKKEDRHSIELYERIIRSIREGRGDTHSEYYKDFLFSLANLYYESKEYDNKEAITLYLEILMDCSETLHTFEKEEISQRLKNIYAESAERAQQAKLDILKKEKEKEQLIVAAQKSMLSFLVHTLRNTMAGVKPTVDETLEIAREELEEMYHELSVYKTINNLASLYTIFTVIGNMLDTYTLYIRTPENILKNWREDRGGTVTMKFLFALALRQIIARLLFEEQNLSQFKAFAREQSHYSLSEIRESFLTRVLRHELTPENDEHLMIWLKTYFPIVLMNFSAQNITLNLRGIRFNILFACISEILYNAIRYADSKKPVKIEWKKQGKDFLFSCQNAFSPESTLRTGSQKGFLFMKGLIKMIDGFQFFDTAENSVFTAQLQLQEQLLN